MFVREGAAFSVMPGGARLDLAEPDPACIRIADIADVLSRSVADPFTRAGYYSIAQRCTIIAREAAMAEGALVGLHALLAFAPHVIADCRAIDSTFHHQRLTQAICEALDLDVPTPSIAVYLGGLKGRMRLSELLCLRAGVNDEIAAMQERGVRPLVGRIVPLNWDAARDAFITSFKSYAALAALPRTGAWASIN